ncbi:MAG: thioesterase family protein [Chloroflexota bacterium]|nr:thioesterase family protein [Chloroflexota bacterium]
MPKSEFKFSTPVRVRWMECDAQGIVFNGAYLGYLEIAQAEYFRNLGFSIYRIAQNGYFDSAVVKADLEFRAPARVDEVLELFARVARIGNTSITLLVEIYAAGSDKVLTYIEAVYVGFYAESETTRRVPDAIRSLVEHFETMGEPLSLEEFPDLLEAAS